MEHQDPEVEIRTLGRLQVVRDGEPVALGGPRPKALLSVLTIRLNTAVEREVLEAELWGGAPPRSAAGTVHSYVSRLRRSIGGGVAGRVNQHVIERRPGGYTLVLDPSRVDSCRFEALARSGQALLRRGRQEAAGRTLQDALRLWQGAPFEDVAAGRIVGAEVERLDGLRLDALEDRIDADILLGKVAEVAAELEALVRDHPLRERLVAQRMLALYRSGRQADALEAYQTARRRMQEEFGAEPRPGLRELQSRVLAHHPDLSTTAGYQLADPGFARRGARGRARPVGNLPEPLTSVVGLAQPVAELCRLVSAHRIVMVTGIGGIGKTTMSLEAARCEARDFRQGAWYIEVPRRGDVDEVAAAFAEALELRPPGSVSCIDELARRIGRSDMLIVADSCEHAPQAAAEAIATLIRRCPRLRVVAVGQERLRVPGEYPWRIRPLAVPPPGSDLEAIGASPAVQLMVERMSRWLPDRRLDRHSARHLAAIARALDGVPLALELAAESAQARSLDEVLHIAAADPNRLRTRARATPRRQRSLRAALSPTLTRLDQRARRLFLRLVVFKGGFTQDAAERVGADPGDGIGVPTRLAELLDRSVVVPVPTVTRGARYDLLRPLRRHARRTLSSEERRRTRQRHLDYYAAFADRAAVAVIGRDQVQWLNRLHEDQSNLREALRWSLAQEDAAAGMRLVNGCWWFWLHFGHRREGAAWARRVMAVDGGEHPPVELHQRFLHAGGRLVLAGGDTAGAQALLRQGLQLAKQSADADAGVLNLTGLALVSLRAGDVADARRLLTSARRAAATQGDWCRGMLQWTTGMALAARRDGDGASRAFLEAEDLFRQAGDEWSACLARLHGARLARARGEVRLAAALHRVNLAKTIDLTASTFDFVGLPGDVLGLAGLARTAGNRELAALLEQAARSMQAESQGRPRHRPLDWWERLGERPEASRTDPRRLVRRILSETIVLEGRAAG